MCGDDQIEPAGKILLIHIEAFEMQVSQSQLPRTLSSEVDGDRRTIDTDDGGPRTLFRIKGREQADAATGIEDGRAPSS